MFTYEIAPVFILMEHECLKVRDWNDCSRKIERKNENMFFWKIEIFAKFSLSQPKLIFFQQKTGVGVVFVLYIKAQDNYAVILYVH